MKKSDYNPPMTKEEKRLYQEINRFYVRHGYSERICKSRDFDPFPDAGRFYIMDTNSYTVLFYNVDPEVWLKHIKSELHDDHNNKLKMANDFKMIQKIQEQGCHKDLKHFKLRAEYLEDVVQLINEIGRTLYGFKMVRDFFPDVEFEFLTTMTSDEIIEILMEQPDPHVMVETLKPFDAYTGEC